MTIFLIISTTLYIIGFYNSLFMSKKNIISFLVASEIMFLGLDMMFIISSLILNIANGLIFGILILMLSVGESALGLGLCITSLKVIKTINYDDYTNLKC